MEYLTFLLKSYSILREEEASALPSNRQASDRQQSTASSRIDDLPSHTGNSCP